MSVPVIFFPCTFWKVSLSLSSEILQLGILILLPAFQYPRAPPFNLFMCFFLVSLCLLTINYKSFLFSFSLLREDRMAHADQLGIPFSHGQLGFDCVLADLDLVN